MIHMIFCVYSKLAFFVLFPNLTLSKDVKEFMKRLLYQERIDSSWNSRGVILTVYEESIGI